MVSTNGVTANFMLFDIGTFGVFPLTYVYLPKGARCTVFPLSEIITFAAAPLALTPICPQPRLSLLLAATGAMGQPLPPEAAQAPGPEYMCMYIYIYIYIHIHTHIPGPRADGFGQVWGGCLVLKLRASMAVPVRDLVSFILDLGCRL